MNYLIKNFFTVQSFFEHHNMFVQQGEHCLPPLIAKFKYYDLENLIYNVAPRR